jgi:N-acetyl-D-muramate 6-phosphate phosphatase
MKRAVKAILFDLDGTLIDSAPDLAGTANDMRRARGLPDLPYGAFRPMVGSGARGMIGAGFGVGPEQNEFAALRDEFLNRYELRMTQLTCVFSDVLPLLAALDGAAIPWGIVTNKATRFALPLVEALNLHHRAAVLVAGDTTPHSKPHPEPLFEAARRIKVDPSECAYVGDDLRDIQAGHAAGMTTVAVRWGYLGFGEPIEAWGAHHIAASPADIPAFVLKSQSMV